MQSIEMNDISPPVVLKNTPGCKDRSPSICGRSQVLSLGSNVDTHRILHKTGGLEQVGVCGMNDEMKSKPLEQFKWIGTGWSVR